MCNEIVFRFFIGCKHGKNQFEVQPYCHPNDSHFLFLGEVKCTKLY